VSRCDFRLWWRVNVFMQCGQVCLPRAPALEPEGLKGVTGVVGFGNPGVTGVPVSFGCDCI